MGIFLNNVQAVFPGDRSAATTVRLDGGNIAQIGASNPCPGDQIVQGEGRLLTPGLIDVHVHGIMHYCFDNGPDDLLQAAACFARFGTTTVLPTIVPKRSADMLPRLAALAEALTKVEGVNMPGLHLEGPFTALPGAGCDVLAGDLGLLDEMLDACRGRVQVMSLSPDTPNIAPVIERLLQRGITPFVTHTRATFAQAQAGIAAGARHATHFYDVFPCPPEADPGVRPPGAVEAFLLADNATVDFIADGCHVHPAAIQLAVRAKTCRGVAVITDGNIGAGLPPGLYDSPWGYQVRVEPGNGARIADAGHPHVGSLAGSALTMDVAMRNLRQWLAPLPLPMIWAMGTTTAAVAAGLPGGGTLAVGQSADLVLWDETLQPVTTWVRGKVAFQA